VGADFPLLHAETRSGGIRLTAFHELVVVDVAAVAKGYRASKLTGSDVVNDHDERIGTIDDEIDTRRVRFLSRGRRLPLGQEAQRRPRTALGLCRISAMGAPLSPLARTVHGFFDARFKTRTLRQEAAKIKFLRRANVSIL
jgi:hypothetical protein